MVAQFSSEFGRLATMWTLPPSASHSAATFFSPGALLAQITTLAPAPAMTLAASAPNAPVAPVTMAVLPLTLNSESGSFRKSSDMMAPGFGCHARDGGHPVSSLVTGCPHARAMTLCV